MANKLKGRPPGSPNVEYVPVQSFPAACPKCHSTELKNVQGAKVTRRNIAGKLPNGFTFGSVEHRRMRCKCGQNLIVRSYFQK